MNNNHLSQKPSGILDRIYGKALAAYFVLDQANQKFVNALLNYRRSIAITGFALILIGMLGMLILFVGSLFGFWSKGFGWFDWPFSGSVGLGIVAVRFPFSVVKELEQFGKIQRGS